MLRKNIVERIIIRKTFIEYVIFPFSAVFTSFNAGKKTLIQSLKQAYIPYFIQVIFSKLTENYDGTLTFDMVDYAYEKLCSESYLGTWSERLAEYQEYELPARQILKLLSVRPSGITRNAMLDTLMTNRDPARMNETDLCLSKVLEMLENDGYIMKAGTLRTFRSPLLRDYWFRKFVQ